MRPSKAKKGLEKGGRAKENPPLFLSLSPLNRERGKGPRQWYQKSCFLSSPFSLPNAIGILLARRAEGWWSFLSFPLSLLLPPPPSSGPASLLRSGSFHPWPFLPSSFVLASHSFFPYREKRGNTRGKRRCRERGGGERAKKKPGKGEGEKGGSKAGRRSNHFWPTGKSTGCGSIVIAKRMKANTA